MYMVLKDGKRKVLTFSYDDGTEHDIRLVEILNRNGLKGTFNINTGLYAPSENAERGMNGRMTLERTQELFKGSAHEVAVHGLTHPFLEKLKSVTMLEEILQDKRNIEAQYGTLARGMAYPYGTYNDEVIARLKECDIAYSRTVQATEKFTFPKEWLEWHPTCHHGNRHLMELAERFVTQTVLRPGENWLFYVWGHSFEFERQQNWGMFETFAEYVGGHDDVWYATNIEIYDYVKAYEALQVSVDETMVHNPTATDVWVELAGKVLCVPAGKTIVVEG